MSLEQHRREAPASVRFGVLTVSDTRDAHTDRGGAYLVQALEAAGHLVTWRAIRRDERAEIESAVREAIASSTVDLLLVTGGTGLAPRDVTAPTLERMFDSTIPGFGELFRWLSFQEIGSAALLSRACAGLLDGKAIFALPGSPKALELALQRIILAEARHIVGQTQQPVRGEPSQP